MGRPLYRTNEDMILRILEARKSTSVPELSRRFNLAQVTIRKIIKGETWANVSPQVDAKRKELAAHLEQDRSIRGDLHNFDNKHHKTHISAFGHPTACGIHNYTLGIVVVDRMEDVTCSNCKKRIRIRRNS